MHSLTAVQSTSSPTTARGREDPWPNMEKQVESMLNDLTLQLQRVRDNPHPTLIAENELLDAVATATEAVEDMRFALDTAMEHPESFAITTDELQRRAEKIRAWERDMTKAQQTSEKIRLAQRRRQQQDYDTADSSARENSNFLRQEHDVQRDVMQTDEQTLDRLHGGIQRVKETTVNINDELQTQDHILNDIDKGMTRVQMRIDGAMKKVGRLLDQTSDTGKMICIAVLFVILILLIVFVVR